MWLDGMPIPGWLRPWVGWVVGTDWPQADERKLFKLSDDLVLAARHVVAGADGAGSRLTENVRGEWDGNALNAFVKRVNQQVGGRQAMLVQKLIGLAIALNELGVQVQYTKRMIKLAVLLFIVQMFWLAWALLNPAGRLTATALMGVRAQTARWTVRQFAQRLVMNVAMFGVLMGGMDYYIQKSQTRRDGMDGKQLLSSMGMGALTGAGLTALAWAVPTKSMWMLMGHSGIASAGATLVSEIMTGGRSTGRWWPRAGPRASPAGRTRTGRAGRRGPAPAGTGSARRNHAGGRGAEELRGRGGQDVHRRRACAGPPGRRDGGRRGREPAAHHAAEHGVRPGAAHPAVAHTRQLHPGPVQR